MKTFKDNAGRTWTLAINVTAIKRVKGLICVDIYKLVDDGFKPLSVLLADPIALIDLIYCLVKEDADRLGISDEDFGRAFAGDVIGVAGEMFVEELSEFFTDPRVRSAIKRIIATSRAMRDKMFEQAEAALDKIDLDSEVEKFVASYGSSPG